MCCPGAWKSDRGTKVHPQLQDKRLFLLHKYTSASWARPSFRVNFFSGQFLLETVQLLRLMFPKNPPRKQRISSKSVKSLLVTTLSELLLLFHHGWCTVADSGGNRSQVTLIALKRKCDLFHWISIEKQSKGFRISGRLSRQLRTDLLLCLLEIAVWGEAQCCDGTSHSVSFCIWEQDAWGITGLFERS